MLRYGTLWRQFLSQIPNPKEMKTCVEHERVANLLILLDIGPEERNLVKYYKDKIGDE
jgi:hypothetical protein